MNSYYFNKYGYDCRNLYYEPAEDQLYLAELYRNKIIPTDVRWMYQGCQSMTTICSAPINCQKCDSFYGMFWNCSSAFMIALDNLKNTHNIKIFSQMFMNCGTDDCQITGSLDLSSATNVDEMFTCFGGSPNSEYTGDPIHLKNVPRSLDLSKISYSTSSKINTCTEGIHYIIDNYID